MRRLRPRCGRWGEAAAHRRWPLRRRPVSGGPRPGVDCFLSVPVQL
ncbi:hypothetical protein [Ornithinimicrobium kibberense]